MMMVMVNIRSVDSLLSVSYLGLYRTDENARLMQSRRQPVGQ